MRQDLEGLTEWIRKTSLNQMKSTVMHVCTKRCWCIPASLLFIFQNCCWMLLWMTALAILVLITLCDNSCKMGKKFDVAQTHFLNSAGDTPLLWVISTSGSVCTNVHKYIIHFLRMEFPQKTYSVHETAAAALLYLDCQHRGLKVGLATIGELWLDICWTSM